MMLIKFNSADIISVQPRYYFFYRKNVKVLSHFMKGDIMWTILHFTELICHLVGGSDRSLYEVLDYIGNKLHSGAKV